MNNQMASDGMTILALGGALGYLITQKQASENLVARSVCAYRANDKPAAGKPTPSDIRNVQEVSGSCPLEDINMRVDAAGKDDLKTRRAAIQREAINFDQGDGSSGVPPPAVIQGVYLTYGD